MSMYYETDLIYAYQAAQVMPFSFHFHQKIGFIIKASEYVIYLHME